MFFRYSTCKYTMTLKLWLGSLNVIGTDTCRSATYDFLLTLHSSHVPISYRSRDKRQFQSKIAKKIPPPCVFCAPAEGVPLRFGTGARGQKTRMMGLPGRERSLTICSAIWIQSTNVLDGHTDGQTDSGRQQRPRLRIASRGKNGQ